MLRRAALALPLAAPMARAQVPRSLRIIVPLPAASVPDILARLMAERLAPALGQNVLVDNRPGAGGAIGVEAAMRAPADGQTLLLGSSGPMAILPAVHRRLPYEPLRDFTPIARVADFPLVLLASNHAGMRSLDEVLARSRIETLDYAGGDIGSTQHLAGALLAARGGLRLNHIPYRGGGLAQADLMAGRIPLMVDSLSAVLRLIRDGGAVPIGMCGPRRNAGLPGVPALGEAVPGCEATGWMGLFAPGATPPAALAAVSAALAAVLAEDGFAQAVSAIGSDPTPQDGPAFRRFIEAELVKWRGLAELAGITAS